MTSDARFWDHELFTKTLVISLVMVMRQIRLEDRAERRLADYDQPMERFLFAGAHEPLAMGIEIRAALP